MPVNCPPSTKQNSSPPSKRPEFVESGMKVGLGTGSTAAWLVQCLGEMVREEGCKIKGVPTSKPDCGTGRDSRDRGDHTGRGQMAGSDD